MPETVPRLHVSAAVATCALLAGCGGRPLAPPTSAPLPPAGGPEGAEHTYAVDTARSKVTIHVTSAGLFGHEHFFRPQRWRGAVRFDPSNPRGPAGADLAFAADSLHDEQPEIAEETRRDKIDKTARGPEVLDAGRYPEVRFVVQRISDLAPAAGASASAGKLKGTLEGILAVHGRQVAVRAPITGEWSGDTLHAKGEARFRQTDVGIDPYSALLGMVAVGDELGVSFDLTAKAPPRPPTPATTSTSAAVDPGTSADRLRHPTDQVGGRQGAGSSE